MQIAGTVVSVPVCWCKANNYLYVESSNLESKGMNAMWLD